MADTSAHKDIAKLTTDASANAADRIAVLEEQDSFGTSFYADFDNSSITGFTAFGRLPQMHEKLIAYFANKKDKPVPEGGYHIFFGASSVFCEPFYFAMLAKRAGLLEDGFLTIHATDLKNEFLKYAKRGIYPAKTIDWLDDDLKQHFSEASYNRVKLDQDIIDAVQFEPPGDIRDHETDRPYDAVVFTNVIYHYLRTSNISALFNAALSLSRGIVVTDHTSFAENAHTFETALLEHDFGVAANDNLGYRPLAQTRKSHSLAERFVPWKQRGALTDISGDKQTETFWAVRAPQA